MIPPTPGADPSSRLFGPATPPDGAGPLGPDELWPQKVDVPFSDILKGLNPLHHVPGVGMIYRAVTGETIPPAMRIFGAGIMGGPAGIMGAAMMSLLEEIIRMGPDTSRPNAPAGMSATGNEQGVQPVTPGTLEAGQYTTLATTVPAWMQDPGQMPGPTPGATMLAAQEYRRAELLEKGLA